MTAATGYPRRVDLRRLRYFVAVAEDRHFTNAAARLHLAQPALSQAIRRLEAELGTKLLHRTRREVKLTYAGSVLFEDAKKILKDVEVAEQRVKAAHEGAIGLLRIGFVDMALYGVLPRLLQRFNAETPGVTVSLHSMGTAALLSALEEGTLDIGLLRPARLHASRVALEVLEHDPLVLAIPVGDPLGEFEQVDMTSIRSLDLIVPERERDAVIHDMILDYFSESNVEVNVVTEVSSIQALLAFVGSGMGIAVVPKRLEAWATEHVVFRPFTPALPPASLAIAWVPERLDPVTLSFLSLARTPSDT
jgi:DNA-binding transcriptional LysR family regulator